MSLESIIARNKADRAAGINRVYSIGRQSKPKLAVSRVIVPLPTLECKRGGTDKDIIQKNPECLTGARHKRKCDKWKVVTWVNTGSAYMNCEKCKSQGLGYLPVGAPEWHEVKGWFSKEEGIAYEGVISNLKVDGDLIEIGTHKGRSAVLAACVILGKNRVLHCVDCWGEPEDEVELEARKNLAPFQKVVEIHKGWSKGTAAKWPSHKPIACVFIDGHHSYESASTDIDSWLSLISYGGIICGHDYDNPQHPGVKKAVDERFKDVKVKGTFWWVEKTKPPRFDYFAPAMTVKERSRLYDLIERVDKGLEGIDHSLCWGGLLGYVRFKEHMLWDDDADFIAVDLPPIEELKRRMPGLEVVKDTYFKVFFPEDFKLPGNNFAFPFVEINPAKRVNGKIVAKTSFNLPDDEFPEELLFPSMKRKFGPIEVSLPADPKALAIHKYGKQSLTSAMPPFWSHRYDKRTDYGGAKKYGDCPRVALNSINPKCWVPEAFLINLDRRPERLEHCKDRLDKAGVSFTRLSAIDGMQGAPSNYYGGAGAYGCLESHKKVLKTVLDKGLQSVMVFEDDVILCPNFLERLADLYAILPPNWDALFLGGQIMGNVGKVWPGLLKVIGGKGVHRTHAYIVRGDYIKTLYDLWSNNKGHCDMIWGREQYKYHVYAPQQWLCGQEEGMSDIKMSVVKERWWGTQPS